MPLSRFDACVPNNQHPFSFNSAFAVVGCCYAVLVVVVVVLLLPLLSTVIVCLRCYAIIFIGISYYRSLACAALSVLPYSFCFVVVVVDVASNGGLRCILLCACILLLVAISIGLSVVLW